MSDFPEFCSQQPLKIFQKFLNRIVAQTSSLYAIIFDSVKNAQFLSELRYSDPTHRKMGIFSHIFAPPPRGGETCEILLANYKGPPMPFHYLYNWLLPLAWFRKSRPDKNRYRKKKKSTFPKYTSSAYSLAAISASTNKQSIGNLQGSRECKNFENVEAGIRVQNVVGKKVSVRCSRRSCSGSMSSRIIADRQSICGWTIRIARL